MEVEVSRGQVGVLVFISVIATLAVLAGLGIVVSPKGQGNRPVLLSAEVRTIENYRNRIADLAQAWQTLADDLADTLEENQDLFSTSTKAQRGFERAVVLTQELEALTTPASLVGLHEQSTVTGKAFVDASLSVARWVSAPTDENRKIAEELLNDAMGSLDLLTANGWIQVNR